MRYDFDTVPFQFMRFKYGVPIMLLLLDEEHMHQNQMRKILGAEIQPIHNALEFGVLHGFIQQKDTSSDERVKHVFSLTPKGLRIARHLKACADQFLNLSSEPHPNPGKSK